MGYFEQMGVRGALLSRRRNGLLVKVKHKSDASGLSTVSDGDLLAGLELPAPKALHALHNIRALFHFTQDHTLATQP